MKAGPECGECLFGLAERMARAGCGGDERLFALANEAARRVCEREFVEGASVPTRVATLMLRAAQEATGARDLFAQAKDVEFSKGVAAAERLKPLFGDTLEELCRLSSAGNRIDFFRKMDEVEAEWRDGDHALAIDDSPEFAAEVGRGGPLLFLADNVGEVPFDLPLLNRLVELGVETSYVVKGQPSQNDVTREDLRRFGVDGEDFADTGTDWVGCELSETGEEFNRLMLRSRLVFSKGMANLETLSEYPEALRGKRVFFALVAKCRPVASLLGVGQGCAAILDGRRLFGG